MHIGPVTKLPMPPFVPMPNATLQIDYFFNIILAIISNSQRIFGIFPFYCSSWTDNVGFTRNCLITFAFLIWVSEREFFESAVNWYFIYKKIKQNNVMW